MTHWGRPKRVTRCGPSRYGFGVGFIRCRLGQQAPDPAWPAFKALVADMREAPFLEKAEERREQIVAFYQREFPTACRCLLDDAEVSLNP